jgi:hypothetical protein
VRQEWSALGALLQKLEQSGFNPVDIGIGGDLDGIFVPRPFGQFEGKEVGSEDDWLA